MKISVREALVGILSKSLTVEQAYATVEDQQDLHLSLEYMSQLSKAVEPLSKPPVSEAQRKAMWAAAKGKSNLGIPKTVGKDFADSDEGGKLPEKKLSKNDDSEDLISWDNNGQWTLTKAIKPGEADLGEYWKKPINTPAPKNIKPFSANPKSSDIGDTGINYKKMNDPKAQTAPKYDIGEGREQQLHANLMNNRVPGVRKNEGTNLEANPSIDERTRMTAKGDMDGYGPAGDSSSSMTMSEKNPQPGEARHEEEEKEEARKIKEKAQKLLDMHKK